MPDLRAIRNRGLFAVLVIALLAVWMLRVAFKLTGVALYLVVIVIAVLFLLSWIGRKARGNRSV